MIKKILAKVLAGPIKLYNKIKIKDYYSSAQINAEEIKELGKTLILVPHVDDEVIGLGGLLSGFPGKNEFHLLYGTDSGDSRSIKDRQVISNIRFDEAEEVAKKLDIKIIDKVLEIQNGSLEWPFDIFKDRLVKILNDNKYDSIFTISFIDNHPEHKKMTSFLAKALEDYEYSGDIYLYEVSNLLPNHWINTYYKMEAKALEEKTKLYDYYPSQTMMDFDIYHRLNRYKGLAIGESQAIEYFARMSKEELIEKVEKVSEVDLTKIIPSRIGNNRSFYKVINREKDVQELYKSKGW